MNANRLSTGISAFDEVLRGGLIKSQAYLVRGGPGTGKTVLGCHFLDTGVKAGEKILFISLEETEEQIRDNLKDFGLGLDSFEFLDLSPSSDFFAKNETYDIFSPSEIEREPFTQQIISKIETLKPTRIFLDPITQIRYLAPDVFNYRKQILSFLRYIKEMRATILFTSENSPEAPDDDLQFLSDGIFVLDSGQTGRSITVTKFRGSGYSEGEHTLQINEKGISVFPILVPKNHRRPFEIESVPSGIPEFDELLNGGIERGTVTILTGPSGVGKTTLGMQFIKESASRGERSTAFIFEESLSTLVRRSDSINLGLSKMLQLNSLSIYQVEPLRHTADEFAAMVRHEVEENDVKIVFIDSLSGYRLSLLGKDLAHNLHALCKYLTNMGVTVLVSNEVDSITGDFKATERGISYLSDTIVFLRYVEYEGVLRKVIGVLKKRLSGFNRSICKFEITKYGIKVGDPIENMQGILLGTPETIDKEAD